MIYTNRSTSLETVDFLPAINDEDSSEVAKQHQGEAVSRPPPVPASQGAQRRILHRQKRSARPLGSFGTVTDQDTGFNQTQEEIEKHSLYPRLERRGFTERLDKYGPLPPMVCGPSTDSTKWIYRIMTTKNKKKTMSQVIKEGLFDEDIEQYHATKAIGSTQLRGFLRSIHRFCHLWNSPSGGSTEAFRLGSALHCLILEPEFFNARFTISSGKIDRRTKAGREEWEKFLLDNAGKEVLTEDQGKDLSGMARSVERNPLAMDLLKDTQREKSARVQLNNGLLVQARPDALKAGKILDLKSCANLEKFRYDARSHGYHIQAAFYYFILSSLFPKEYGEADFYFIAVDKTEIHECGVYGLENSLLKQILHDHVKPALQDLGKLFNEVDDWTTYVPEQTEVEWLNVF